MWSKLIDRCAAARTACMVRRARRTPSSARGWSATPATDVGSVSYALDRALWGRRRS